MEEDVCRRTKFASCSISMYLSVKSKKSDKAMENFLTIIRKGGFGFVYKGTLANGVILLVKVFSDAS